MKVQMASLIFKISPGPLIFLRRFRVIKNCNNQRSVSIDLFFELAINKRGNGMWQRGFIKYATFGSLSFFESSLFDGRNFGTLANFASLTPT